MDVRRFADPVMHFLECDGSEVAVVNEKAPVPRALQLQQALPVPCTGVDRSPGLKSYRSNFEFEHYHFPAPPPIRQVDGSRLPFNLVKTPPRPRMTGLAS